VVVIPPRAILAAVDFSEPSRVALEFAARLANQSRAALHVLHVEDPLLAAAARTQGIDLSHETREELARFTAPSLAAAWTPLNHHVVSGQSTQTICDIASREQADFIVLGVHGMSGVTRALFGSTTEGVLERAATPVFVIPDSWVPPHPAAKDLSGMGPVIAAIESSCSAVAGAAAAARLAETLKTTVSAIHVVPALHVLDRWRPHAEAAVAEQMTKARTELETALVGAKTDLDIPLRIVTGSIPEQLAAAVATSGPHSMLVMGRHVRGSRRGVPGATAYRVLGLAHVPVLVHCLSEQHP
jgi:nucleotide-binding universal stress UspA family protein